MPGESKMGQLEKYGLYVLCLVIFLILGVAVWGGDPVSAQHYGQPAHRGGAHDLDASAGTSNVLGNTVGNRNTDNQPMRTAGNQPTSPIDDVRRQIEGGRPVAGGDGPSQGNAANQLDSVLASMGGEGGRDGGGEDGPEDSPKQDPMPKPGPQVVSRSVHTIAKGENFSVLGWRLYKDEAAYLLIQKLNPGVDSSNLRIGDQIVLPTPDEVAQWRAKRGAGKATSSGGGAASRIYTVRQGDSFWRIAAKELGDGTRAKEIAALNPGVDSSKLKLNQVINIPAR